MMAKAENEVVRRVAKRSMGELRNKRTEMDVTVQMLVAEQAIKAVVPVEVKKAWAAGGGGATIIIVPSPQWVSHIATAVEDIRDDLHVYMKSDPKRKEEDSGAIGRALASGRGVVAITPSAGYLPKLFKTVGDRTLQIEITTGLIAPVIRTVATGRLPRSFLDLNVNLLDFDEVCGLIVPRNTASDIHARFERAILAKTSMSRAGERLPDLEHATEFGAARLWAMDLKQDLSDYQGGKISFEDVDKGIVLHGPPGTGKTVFARALGEYLGIPVVLGSMAEFFASSAGYLDSVVKAQRELFERAKANRPCLIFVDELDACPDLDRAGRNKDWWGPVVNDFLALLDGAASDREGIIVIGATNRVDALAPALLRPGRFERKVFLGPPDEEGILRILRHHLAGDLLECDLSDIVHRCVARNMTAAVLMERVRVAKRTARRHGRPMIPDDLTSTILPKDNRSDADMLRVATHEAGHALMAGLKCPELLISVDVEPDGVGGGGSTMLRHLTSATMTRRTMMSQVRVLLAGRAAEILMFGEHSAGSGGGLDSDLHKATSLLAMGAASFGLDEVPRWRCKPDEAVASLMFDAPLREQVEDTLAEAASSVQEELQGLQPMLQALIDALLAERRLSAERVLTILAEAGAVSQLSKARH